VDEDWQMAKEKLICWHANFGKRHKLAGWAITPLILISLAMISILDHFVSNGKKYFCIGAVFLFFVMSSSFSFPIFEDMEFTGQTMLFITDSRVDTRFAGEEGHGRMAGQEEDAVDADVLDEVDVLDDSDVLDGYEDSELENMDDIDKYTLDEILEGNNAAAAELAQSGGVQQSGEAVFDRDDWRLLLINKQHPIPEDYTFELGTIKGSMKCDKRIIEDLLAMLQGAKNDGINLVICSPYRDLNRQEVLFNRKIKTYMGRGMSYMDAYKISSQAVTVPGASEHQIGLALDIVCDNYFSLNEGFGETEAGRWLQEHSCEYGFTLRYPKGKEYITGIEYEPWHFRYVGKEAATVMKEKGICLEEFVDSL